MFGFASRIEWCGSFISWCANECRYLENGIMPRAIGCVVMMNWYKEHDRLVEGNQEPLPGMIVCYDWDDPDGDLDPQDAKPDHLGIVEKVADGKIYTIEGNTENSCQRREREVGEHEIMGFGSPKY